MNKNRYKIKEIHICPFKENEYGLLSIDMGYPTRWCVIDDEKKVAIDIKTQLKYQYVEIVNGLYFVDKPKDLKNKRFAVQPYALGFIPKECMESAINIVNDLKNDEEFIDGNEALNNKEYLQYLKEEKNQELSLEKNVKVIRKEKK